jgi:hypothetical protein
VQPSETKVTGGFPEFWDTVHAKYRVYFDASALLQPLVNRIKQQAPTQPLHKVVRRLTIVAANSYGALITLVLNGYGNDAMKIARSIFEADVTVGYLRRHPEELDDYLDYDCIQQKHLYDYVLKYCPEQTAAIDPPSVEELLERHTKVAPRFKGRSRWCRKGIRQMAEDLGEGLDQIYLTFYRWASDMHHVSVRGLTLQVEAESLDVDLAPSENWLEQALVAGLGSTLRLAMRSNEELELGLDKDLEDIVKLYRDATAA